MSEMFQVVFEWMQTIDAASFLFFVFPFLSNFNDKRNYILVISSGSKTYTINFFTYQMTLIQPPIFQILLHFLQHAFE